ncbi:MAG TPA: TetR/AcrR family transcriptional regulator [Clostridiaceae bacterium]|nr:TetR/AcrR family transcriptional regulator [Clostridiaceae bacterium]
MPKLIENVKKRILEAAKNELLESEYSGFTIRSVAARCGIAVGTVYNYFPTKDTLAASVMLDDWNKALSAMRQSIAQSDTITDGLYVIYKEIEHFSNLYRRVWSQYTSSARFISDYSKRHNILLSQLSEIVHSLLRRFEADEDSFLDGFVSENLLLAAVNHTPFQPLAVLLDRIFIHNRKERDRV